MKKIYVTLLILFSCFSLNAQVVNGGFENWINDSVPETWNGTISVDVIIQNYEFNTVSKTNDSYSESFAAVVSTGKTIPYVEILLPGIISYGNNQIKLNISDFSLVITSIGGIPINVIPTKIKGYYKYSGVNNDTMAIYADCFYNSILIGQGVFSDSCDQTLYVPFEIDIAYSEEEVPDMINIIATSSGGYMPQAGSMLYLDDLSMEYTMAGISESLPLDMLSIYPNPTTGLLTLKLNSGETNIVNIYDYTGKLIETTGIDGPYFTLDMRSYVNGSYFVEVVNSGGRNTQKVVLAR
ncbi:MAG TPA: T9SS type A sorting domain-containing protein [Bacteroidales bacterium]|nr:T9SS type A sorting domain-containing protein [Bacteroidales bacterium]